MVTVTIRLNVYQMQCIMPCLPSLPFPPFNTETLDDVSHCRPLTGQVAARYVASGGQDLPFLRQRRQCLSLAAPDALEETIPLCQSVQGIVALSHGANESGESVDVVLAGDLAAGLVDLGDGDLDGSVVLGLDDPVGGGALSGDVARRRKHKLAHAMPYHVMQCHAIPKFNRFVRLFCSSI